MAQPNYDPVDYILWMTWFYPGMIVIACYFCHISANALKESGTLQPTDIVARRELGFTGGLGLEQEQYYYNPGRENDTQPKDVEEKLINCPPSKNEGPSWDTDAPVQHPSHSSSSKKMTPEANLKIALFWQAIQLLILQRMGHTAAKDRLITGDPIYYSVVMLAICTIVVLLSVQALYESWKIAGSGSGMSKVDRRNERVISERSSRLPWVAFFAALVPWHELMAAKYWP